jgi:hypothetical protein
MKTFKFICSTVIWYNIINKVNIASKVLKGEILTNTLQYLNKCCSLDGFSSCLIDAKQIASDFDVEYAFCKENPIR